MSKRLISLLVMVTLAGLVCGTSLAAAKTHRLTLSQQAKVSGVELRPGEYRLKINPDNEVEIYDGKQLVAKTKAEVKPLERELPNSVTLRNGNLVEIRLKKEKLILLGS